MKVKTKMQASGITVDECIAALQTLKEKGVPGDALLGVPMQHQPKIVEAMKNQANEELRGNRTSTTVLREKEILDGARLTFWVEFEQ